MPVKRKTTKTTTTAKSGRTINVTVSGRGAYNKRSPSSYTYENPGPWGRIGRMAGATIGRALGGGSVGSKVGSTIGGLAHYVGKLFGSGEYRIGMAPKMNSLFKGSTTPSNLSFGDRSVRMQHREYLGDIRSSNTSLGFALQRYVVNAGQKDCFPYLSEIARSFQMYRFRGLIFEFVSTSTDSLNSTNTALGQVMMVAEYNVYSPAPKSKHEVLNSNGAMSVKPSDSMLVGIECDPKKGNASEFFVRALHNSTDVDRRMSDMCNLYIATSGIQGTNVLLGSIYVTYDVDLMMPVTEQAGSFDLTTELYFLSPGQYPIPPYNDYRDSPEYTISSVNKAFNPIGIISRFKTGTQSPTAGGSYLCFPPTAKGGYFRINFTAAGSSGSIATPGISLSQVQQVYASYDTNGSTNEYMCLWYVVYIPESGTWRTGDLTGEHWPNIQFYGGTLPAGMTTGGEITCQVTRLNPQMIQALYPTFAPTVV